MTVNWLINLFFVGFGGFIGATARYLLSIFSEVVLPVEYEFLGIAFINLTGCFIIGMVAGFFLVKDALNIHLQLFVISGFLGSFTTFSAFAFQSFFLLNKQELLLTLINVGFQVVGGIWLVWLGYRISAQ